ncbi:aminodeoxychorismate/anthranilate synthase component II [Patescibacteria group bacterium]|nr:aminodeoxychorismate/anthranilate synthase component II [Patescibacteria group bacterium]
MKKILLIDNYDSFTYNLVQQIRTIEPFDIFVKRNDEIDINDLKKNFNFDKIVISPGPKTPSQAGISNAIIAGFYAVIPILGVCLGMQCMNEVFGGKTIRSPLPLHGKTSLISHSGRDIFQDIPQNMEVARYHSLIIDDIPNDFEIIAHTKDNIPMAIKHKKYPIFGVQFHPESFMTPYGNILMENFLNI